MAVWTSSSSRAASSSKIWPGWLELKKRPFWPLLIENQLYGHLRIIASRPNLLVTLQKSKGLYRLLIDSSNSSILITYIFACRIFVFFQMEFFGPHFAIFFRQKCWNICDFLKRTRSCKEKWNTLFPCQSVPCVWQSLVFSLIFGVNSGGKRRTFLHHYFKEVKPIRGWRKSVCLWH